MHIPRKFGAVAIATTALTLTLAAGSAAARTANAHFSSRDSHAVFVQTDNPAGNAIAVYQREHGGQLVAAGTYPTGGEGGVLAGSVVDHLASQNSLVYDAQSNLLLAVNAGSDSLSVFAVDGDHLQLRQVIGSGGSFPVSIAVHGNVVYALNALAGGDVSGFYVVGQRLVAIPGSTRTLGLDPDATPQFVTTPGDIAFTPDGRNLLVTTKDNTNDIDVFSVDPFGRLSGAPVINAEPGTVPFALAVESDDQIAVGEAGTNAVATFTLKWNGTLQPISSVGTGQSATCWLVADGPALFAGNAGSGTESTALNNFGSLSLAATTPTDAGTVDAAVSPSGRYLYVQTGAAGVLDEFQVGAGASLQAIGSVTVPNATGGEGIAIS